jgi:hypothetical protein
MILRLQCDPAFAGVGKCERISVDVEAGFKLGALFYQDVDKASRVLSKAMPITR